MERARLTADVGAGDDAALEQYRAIQGACPDHGIVSFVLGLRLLARDDAEGVPLVEAAMAADDSATAVACQALRDYHWRAGHQDEAHAWHRKLVARQELEDAARAERAVLLVQDTMEPHGLSAEALAALRQSVAAVSGVRQAYFVRKRVRSLPEQPCYVLGFSCTPWWRWPSNRRRAETQQRLFDSVAFPGETFILGIDGDNRRFRRKLRRIPGSPLL